MEPNCESCLFILRKLDSCPKSEVFSEGRVFDMLLQIIWVTSSVLPFILILLLVGFLIKNRRPRYMLMTGCLMVQVAVNEVILKNIFRESRPLGACSPTYGFPSGHSSFASFFLTWLVLEGIYMSERATFKKEKYYLLMRNLAVICCPFVPISRLFLNYHTVKQICCGILIGCLVASACFYYLIEKGHQDWYEELSFNKATLSETFVSNDLESEAFCEKNPPIQKFHSLQPMQHNSEDF